MLSECVLFRKQKLYKPNPDRSRERERERESLAYEACFIFVTHTLVIRLFVAFDEIIVVIQRTIFI